MPFNWIRMIKGKNLVVSMFQRSVVLSEAPSIL